MKYIVFSLSLVTLSANALQLNSVSTFIEPTDKSVAVEAINSDKTKAHLFSVSVSKIKSPYTMETDGSGPSDEMTYTPSKMIVPAGKSINVRFFYNGPSDDKERYYKIDWTDVTFTAKGNGMAAKKAEVTARANLATVLVVRPRNINYAYSYADGLLRNTGNSTLRVVASGTCAKENDKKDSSPCSVRTNLTPGKSTIFNKLKQNKELRIGVWEGKMFVPVSIEQVRE
ncbi:hypothetical protein [Aeromonas enteropelogenes]|uniref:EcpB family pilus assembly chaperone n=1 Tax=Aeromonas enteropelogenes TaxID=29489 RepID=UPI003BA06015